MFMRLRFESTSLIIGLDRDPMGPDDDKSISRNVASLNILAHDVTNLLYYEH